MVDRRSWPGESWLTTPFWDSAIRHILVRQRCTVCTTDFFIPQVACPACLSESWEWVPSSGLGTVESYTICHRAPTPGFPVPYVLALIRLEEGWMMLSNIIDAVHKDLAIGMAVEVAWRSAGEGRALPVFAPRTSR